MTQQQQKIQVNLGGECVNNGSGGYFFIRYTCESSIVVVQSQHDHGCNKLCCGTVRQEWLDRCDSLSARNVI